jgi:hypothetical protein
MYPKMQQFYDEMCLSLACHRILFPGFDANVAVICLVK